MRRTDLSALARYGIFLAIGFALGISLGVWQERARTGAMDGFGAAGQTFFLSQRADLHYCAGNDDAAREALLAWLSHLDETRPLNGEYRNPLMTTRGIAVDKMLALGRLAILEEKRGQPTNAKQYWQRAETEAKSASWNDPTETAIRSAIERIDNCSKSPAKP